MSSNREAGGAKAALCARAQALPRAGALATGALRKQNGAGKWQKRHFEVLSTPLPLPGAPAPSVAPAAFFVYYKDDGADSEMLCAMDLFRSSLPALAVADEELATAAGGAECDFAITWDRFRVFRAPSRSEAKRWVAAIRAAQARNPNTNAPSRGAAVSPAAAAAAVEARAAARAAGASYGTSAPAGPSEGAKAVQQTPNWGEASSAPEKEKPSCCTVS